MTRRFKKICSGGFKRSHSKAAWLVHNSAMETEILTLPTQKQAVSTKKRKTVDVVGRLITREQLRDISLMYTNLTAENMCS